MSHLIHGIYFRKIWDTYLERSALTDSVDLQSPRDDSRDTERSSNSQAEAVRSLGDTNPPGSTTPSMLQVEDRQPLRNERDHFKIPEPPEDVSQDAPREAQLSYWVTLSVVCCPCFAQRLFRWPRPVFSFESQYDTAVNTSQLSTFPTESHNTQSVLDRGRRRRIDRILNAPSTLLTGERHFDLQASRFNVDERHTFPEIPGEALRDERNFLSPIPRLRASSFLESYESEVDRLLREWTTIYDVSAPLNEESTGDGSVNSREIMGREQSN